jgi:phosphoglycerate dehydrogenase-like enzyme
MTSRVLISDKLSPAAVAIFKERGVEVDVKPGLDKDELAKIIGDYDGLAIRSATKVTAKLLERATKLKVVGRAGIGCDRQRRDRDEHAVRQFDHHRRACDRADICARTADSDR